MACHHNTRSGPPWHGRLQTGTARRARSRQDGRHARRRRTCTTEGPGRTSRPSVGQGNRVLRSSVECSPDCRSGDRGFESRQDRRGPDNEPPEAHDHSPTVRFQPVARPGASTTGLSPVAQSAERPPVKRMVPGSSPGWGAVPFQRHAARGVDSRESAAKLASSEIGGTGIRAGFRLRCSDGSMRVRLPCLARKARREPVLLTMTLCPRLAGAETLARARARRCVTTVEASRQPPRWHGDLYCTRQRATRDPQRASAAV